MNHYEDVLGFVDVLVSIRVVVVVLDTKSIFQFSLKSVKDPVWVNSPTKSGPDMLLFLSL